MVGDFPLCQEFLCRHAWRRLGPTISSPTTPPRPYLHVLCFITHMFWKQIHLHFYFSLACSRILGSLSLASFSLQGIESSKFTFNFHVSRTSAYFKNKIKERNLDYSYLHDLSIYFGLWRSCIGVWKITTAESSRIACLRVCVHTCMCRGMRGPPQQLVAIHWMTSVNNASSESNLDRLMNYVTAFGLVTMPVCASLCRKIFSCFLVH